MTGSSYPDDRLRVRLRDLGIRQIKAAFDLGLSQSRFNRFCLGWEDPDEQMKARIAQYLGVGIESIWAEEEVV